MATERTEGEPVALMTPKEARLRQFNQTGDEDLDLPSDLASYMWDAVAYWSKIAVDGRCARKSDISPVTMPKSIVPHVLLFDMHRDPLDASFRLVGAQARKLYVENPLGKRLHEVFDPQMTQFLYGVIETALHYEQPIYSENTFRGDPNTYRRVRRLLLPVSTREDLRMDIMMMVCELTYSEHKPYREGRPLAVGEYAFDDHKLLDVPSL